MIALWYTGGELREAPFQDGRRHIRRVKLSPLPFYAALGPIWPEPPTWTEVAHRLERGEVERAPAWHPYTRAERRWYARTMMGRGRRKARRFPQRRC